MASRTSAGYESFAKRIVASRIITDPWFQGEPRFREAPVVLDAKTAIAMYADAEAVARVYNDACLLVRDAPELLDDFFALSPSQKAMWLASQPQWHGIARADVFMTASGPAFAELNCDTPTGEAEAVILNRLALQKDENSGLVDPNEALRARFLAMLDALAAPLATRAPARRSVGIVYPTELTEDLALVRLYRAWLEEAGFQVLLGSPYNLGYERARVTLFGEACDVLVRHYKADWWGDRTSAWVDERIADAAPLDGPLAIALTAAAREECVVVNPMGAVLPQNKRMMAFFWEHLHAFSEEAQAIIQRHIPITARLETMHVEQLRASREEWVLKSDYGAEGDEVVVGRAVSEAVWRASLEQAREGRWVAQRFFEALTNERGEAVNYGVYVIAGEAAGLYARVQKGATDARALSAPLLIDPR